MNSLPSELICTILNVLAPKERVKVSITCPLWHAVLDRNQLRRELLAAFAFPKHQGGLDAICLEREGRDTLIKTGLEAVSLEAIGRCAHSSAALYSLSLTPNRCDVSYIDPTCYSGRNVRIPHCSDTLTPMIVAPSLYDTNVTISYFPMWEGKKLYNPGRLRRKKTWRVPKSNRFLWIPVDLYMSACYNVQLSSDVPAYVVYTASVDPNAKFEPWFDLHSKDTGWKLSDEREPSIHDK